MNFSGITAKLFSGLGKVVTSKAFVVATATTVTATTVGITWQMAAKKSAQTLAEIATNTDMAVGIEEYSDFGYVLTYDDTILETVREKLEEEHINIDSMYLSEDYDYLNKFIQAELATNYPNIAPVNKDGTGYKSQGDDNWSDWISNSEFLREWGGGEFGKAVNNLTYFQGIIHIIRRDPDMDDKEFNLEAEKNVEPDDEEAAKEEIEKQEGQGEKNNTLEASNSLFEQMNQGFANQVKNKTADNLNDVWDETLRSNILTSRTSQFPREEKETKDDTEDTGEEASFWKQTQGFATEKTEGMGQEAEQEKETTTKKESEHTEEPKKEEEKKELDGYYLEYMPYGDEETEGTWKYLVKQQDEKSFEELKTHFSIDEETWDIYVTTYTKVAGSENSFRINEQKINYKNVVSKYSVPFEFLVSLLQVSNNPEWVAAVADMIMENSKIDLVIQDCLTTKKVDTYRKPEKEDKKDKLVGSTVTETNSICAYIREVDTWIVNVTQEVDRKHEGPTSQTSGVVDGKYTVTTTESVTYGDGVTTTGSSGSAAEGATLPNDATIGVAEDIPESVKQKMQGVSMKGLSGVTYDDLKYLTIPYINFSGTRSIGHMVVSKDVADDVLSIFEELYKIGYPIEKMEPIENYNDKQTDILDSLDRASMGNNNTSAFCDREVNGTGKISFHALGRAIDINPKINPAVGADRSWVSPKNASLYMDRSMSGWSDIEKKSVINKNSEIYKIFIKHGWRWLGDESLQYCSYYDYQHFEKP